MVINRMAGHFTGWAFAILVLISRQRKCDYHGSTSYEIADKGTVKDLVKKLDLDPEEIKIVFVNHEEVTLDSVLKEGDQVALAPKTGGMQFVSFLPALIAPFVRSSGISRFSLQIDILNPFETTFFTNYRLTPPFPPFIKSLQARGR
jgi:sulfur carrier protein ThiS